MINAAGLSEKDLLEQIPARHSVRSFTDEPISKDVKARLEEFIDACNGAGNLSMQLALDEPRAFSGMLAKYGSFSNVRNYIACIGPKGENLEEKVGYWGEMCILAAQALGLNTCWVALTYSKRHVRAAVAPGEKLVAVIAIGHGTTQGRPRKSKTVQEVSNATSQTPIWFLKGVEAALLAPTAMNQQKFSVEYVDGDAKITDRGGAYSAIDLGIVKAHFDLGSGRDIGKSLI